MVDEEIETLRSYAQRSANQGNQNVSNLLNRYAIHSYQRMADEVASVAGRGRVLDWGCGYGHMSYLLRRRGFDVAGLTVPDENNLSDSWTLLSREQGLEITVADDDVVLPFADGSLDVVLSCGVLEHVPHEEGSLREIARVLRPGGHFIIYQLPNWLSVVEWLSERLIGVAHERRYRLGEIRQLLSEGGFTVSATRHGSMIPKNLDRIRPLRRLFDSRYRFVTTLDSFLLQIPILNLVSGTWEVIAQKAGEQLSQRTERLEREPELAAPQGTIYGAYPR